MSKLKVQFSKLTASAGVLALVAMSFARDAAAQAVTPGGQAGFLIDPLEPNVPIVDDTAVRDNLTNINVWVNSIFTILSGVALAYFLYNVVRFVLAKGPEDKEAARSALGISFLGMLAVTAMWGILTWIMVAFGFGGGGTGSRIAI